MSDTRTPVLWLGDKTAGESLDYYVDFDDIPDGTSIVAHSVTSSNATIGTTGADGKRVIARISAGTASTTIRALYQATGSDGQIYQCYAMIPVVAVPE